MVEALRAAVVLENGSRGGDSSLCSIRVMVVEAAIHRTALKTVLSWETPTLVAEVMRLCETQDIRYR